MAKQTAVKKTKIKGQENFDKVMKRFNRSNTYVKDKYRDDWSDYTKLYYNERVNAGYAGNSEIFMPETFTIVQAVKAHVLGDDPKVKFMPTRADQKADTNVLNQMLDFIWTQDSMGLKAGLAIEDMLTIGNAYLFSFWGPDGYPTTRYVHAQDAFFDIANGLYQDQRFCGYRYITSKKDLEDEMIMDPETGEMVKRYKNLEWVESASAEQQDKTAKAEKEEMFLGAQFKDEDTVEVIVYIDKERMVSIANRSVVIEDIETPFKRDATTIQSVDDMGNQVPVEIPAIKPFLPYAPIRNYVDGNLFYARGDIQIIADLQERLNDVSTQKFDNLTYILDRMYTLDPAYADRVDEIQNMPGAVFTIPKGALEEITTTPIGNDADKEKEDIKDAMRRATAADELVQGGGQDQGMLTATEVRAQISQSGTRFKLKLRQLEEEGLKIWAGNIFKLIQINVNQEIMVRTIGPEGVEWQNYNPGEYLGEYEPKVMLEAHAAAVSEERKQEAMQFHLMASQQPWVDQQKLFVETAKAVFNKNENEVKGLLVQQQPLMDPATGEMVEPPMPGMPNESGQEPVNVPGMPQGPQPK